jgi:hypothetical protein
MRGIGVRRVLVARALSGRSVDQANQADQAATDGSPARAIASSFSS